jgi:predicted metal-binding protein
MCVHLGEYDMARIAILYCKRIKDHSCIACAKCFKGIHEKNAEFARHEDIDLVAMTDCGDCPGLIELRVKFLVDLAKNMGREIETLHLGTCMQTAMATSACPLDYDDLKVALEAKFGLKVVLGTHSY